MEFQIIKKQVTAKSRILRATFTYNMGPNWVYLENPKEILAAFPRVYNRKKRYHGRDFTKAGYPSYMIDDDSIIELPEIRQWCRETFGNNNFAFIPYESTFYFTNENDQLLFIMRWA